MLIKIIDEGDLNPLDSGILSPMIHTTAERQKKVLWYNHSSPRLLEENVQGFKS
jgi:hypothetical protein